MKAALFRFGHSGHRQTESGRKGQAPEWTCRPCGASNWADRQVCRRCKQPRQQQQLHEATGKTGKGNGKGLGKPPLVRPEPVTWAEKVRLAQAKAQ